MDDLNEDPQSTIGATEEYKAAWHEKYGKDEVEDTESDEEVTLDKDPSSTYGATENYENKWHEEYGHTEPAGNASKAEWVQYAVAQGADEGEAEQMTVADLKDAYSGAGHASAASQAGNSADTQGTSQGVAAGGGVDSGTAEGTADSGAGTSSAGARAKS